MRNRFYSRSRQLLLSRLHRFRRDIGGVASIEFALVVPVMVLILIGMFELSQMVSVDRRVRQVASSTADLVARATALTTADMDGVLDVVEQLMKPHDHTVLRLSVLSVGASVSNANNTTVCWVRAHKGGVGGHTRGSAYKVPANMLEAGDSVIVAKVEYAHQPVVFSAFTKSTQKLTETFYLKPRYTAEIKYNNLIC